MTLEDRAYVIARDVKEHGSDAIDVERALRDFRAETLKEAANRAVAWLLDGFAEEWLSPDAQDTLCAAIMEEPK